MGNFFEDIWGTMFGSSPEKRRLDWADQGPITTQNFMDSQIAAYWQAIFEQEQQNRDRFKLYEEQHAQEIGRLDSAQETLRNRLASMKENLLQQRDTQYGEIEKMYNEQGEQIANTHDAARGSAEVQSARRGFLGTTVAQDRQESLYQREDASNRKNSEWRSDNRATANNAYNNAVAQADVSIGGQIAGLEAQKGEADRALTTFKESLYRQFPVQMSAVPQMQYDALKQLYGTDWDGMEIITKAGQPGMVQQQLGSMFSGMLTGGVNAAIGGLGGQIGSMFGGMGGGNPYGSGAQAYSMGGGVITGPGFDAGTGGWMDDIYGSYQPIGGSWSPS